MLRRPLPAPPTKALLPSLLGVGVLWGVIVTGGGCGNISLSSGVDFAPVSGGGAVRPPDASVDAGNLNVVGDGAALGAPAPADAAASISVGNPLCFYDYPTDAAPTGAHTCAPDTSSQCAPSDPDAGVYAPSDDGGEGGAPATACHVVPAGDGYQKCSTAGPGGDGAQCQTGADCAATFECVGSPGQCRHYCCGGNAACDSASGATTGPTFCDVEATTAGGLNVPVCEPVRSCTPLLMGSGAGTCPKGETCAVVKDDGTTSCVPIGTVGIGGDCDVFHCAAELTCLGPVGSRTCFQLCEVDSPTACPFGTTCTSSAQLFTNANVGICQ
jgi:hypothetical protein